MTGFHHRSAFGSSQRRFKAKSKGKQKRANNGRVVGVDNGSVTVLSSSKAVRLNTSNQIRSWKQQNAMQRKQLGHKGLRDPPRIVALLPMHERTDVSAIRARIVRAYGGNEKELATSGPITLQTMDGVRTYRITLITANCNMLSMLDAAKVADIIMPIVCPQHKSSSSNKNDDDDDDDDGAFGVNERCEAFVRAIKAQGLPAVLALAQGLDEVAVKRQHIVKKTCLRYLQTLFDVKIKLLPADARDDMRAMQRMLYTLPLKDLSWRTSRAYMLGDSIRYDESNCTLVLTGYVRGTRVFDVNGLVHVTGHGDFQLARIDFQRLPKSHTANDMNDDSNAYDNVVCDTTLQMSLQSLRDINPLANEQSMITEEELCKADAMIAQQRSKERKCALMKSGVSEYKASWEAIVSSDDDDGDYKTHLTSAEDTAMHVSNEEEDDHVKLELKFRMQRDEMEFPDEVDTPLDHLAKDRFQRYRGLQSFHDSPWDAHENLPLEYARIVQFDNFVAARKRVIAEATPALSKSPVVAGTRVALYLSGVSPATAAAILSSSPWSNSSSFNSSCVVVSALLHHEHEVSVCHYKLKRSTTCSRPVRNKDELLWNVGFRRFEARPIFSTASTKSCRSTTAKHKVERFLQPQRFAMASMYARVTFAPACVIALRRQSFMSALEMVATGIVDQVDAQRINVKRIVLTGYPIRVYKRKAVVRHMFFTPDDIRWFQPVSLTTKYGLVGQIDEPVGTHGYFKCSFDGFIKPHDTVCLVLYKRQFPPWDASRFTPHACDNNDADV